MRHPSAFYLDDQAVTSTGEPVTIRAFVTRSGGRQLVRVEYADSPVCVVRWRWRGGS